MRSIALAGAAAAAGWAARHLSAPAVLGWRPGTGRSGTAGRLRVRTFGSGARVVVLLHGMAAAGNCFGAGFDPLGRHTTVVVPDLLGFGASTVAPGLLTAADHLDALDGAMDALGLSGQPLLVVGHSMGGVLALCWAARQRRRVTAVVTLCAALYRTRAEADEQVRRMGPAEALLAGDGSLPQTLCAWMCHHRTAASWLSVAVRPDLPIPVARSAVKHTWDTYRSALNNVLRSPDWEPALHQLCHAGVPVTMAEAARDPVPVPGRAANLATTLPGLRHRVHPTANHLLPMIDAPWCSSLITPRPCGQK